MIRVGLLVVLFLAGLGCDRAGPRADLLLPERAGPPDELDRLLARLPSGAERCAGARVGAVASERRASVRRLSGLSGLGALAWGADAPIASYAEVRQEHPERRRQAIFALVRVSSVDRMREYVEAHREIHVTWSEGGVHCPGPDCWELRVEPMDERTVRVRQGPWEERGRGSEVRCVDLARRFPEALEVSAWTAADGLFSSSLAYDESGMGFDVASVLVPRGPGLRRVEQYRLPHAELAEEISVLLETMRDDRDGIGTIAERSRVTHGDVLEVRTDVLWEDLELLSGDEERYREALAMEAVASAPLPLNEVDYEDLGTVEEQVALRTAALADASPNERRVEAEALRTLLERAADSHPGHDVFAQYLVELLLGELDDAAAAVSLAEKVLTRGPHDRRAWQARRRRALAQVGPEALAEALTRDGVVSRPRRARAAAEALSRIGPSADYEAAEGAWLTGEALARVTPRMARARGRLPLEAVAETMLTLADAGGSSRSVHVRVASEAQEATRVRAMGNVFQWAEGGARIRAGADTTDAPDGAFRMLHEMLSGARGRVTVTLAMTPIGGDLEHPEALVALEGDVREGALELRRASALHEGRERTAVRWERVGALVGEPLDGYEVRLFPPPNVHVDLADAAEADAFLARVEDESALSCIRLARRDATIRCNASPQRDATRRAWRRIMAPLVFR